MVWSCVGGGTVRVTASSLGVSAESAGGHLETVQLILHLSGLSHQARHSVHGQGLTHQG